MSVTKLPEIEHAPAQHEDDTQHRPCGHIHLRCFVYRSAGKYIAECIDLDLAVEEKTIQRAITSLNEAIDGYIKVAVEGDSTGLLPRRSPLRNRLMYHGVAVLVFVLKLFRRERGLERRVRMFDVNPSLCY